MLKQIISISKQSDSYIVLTALKICVCYELRGSLIEVLAIDRIIHELIGAIVIKPV